MNANRLPPDEPRPFCMNETHDHGCRNLPHPPPGFDAILSPDSKHLLMNMMASPPCAERAAALERGAIALVAGDKLRRVWAGKGTDDGTTVEFVMVGVDGVAGDLWAMGRFRVTSKLPDGTPSDGRAWGSGDPSWKIRVSAPRTIRAGSWDACIVLLLHVAMQTIRGYLIERDGQERQGEAAADFIASVLAEAGCIAGIASIDT